MPRRPTVVRERPESPGGSVGDFFGHLHTPLSAKQNLTYKHQFKLAGEQPFGYSCQDLARSCLKATSAIEPTCARCVISSIYRRRLGSCKPVTCVKDVCAAQLLAAGAAAVHVDLAADGAGCMAGHRGQSIFRPRRRHWQRLPAVLHCNDTRAAIRLIDIDFRS